MPLNSDEVLRILTQANPWWESQRVPRELTQPYHRRDFYVLRQDLRRQPIVALGGPRQVGKTTILYQLIEELLAAGVGSNRILFVSFDLPGLTGVAPDPITDCLNVYVERVLGRALREVDNEVYVFFDEITRIDNWDRSLKGWYDLRYPIRFVVSSSSLSELRAGSAKSLAGRISTHLLLSWKFVDVLMMRSGNDRWNDTGLRVRDSLRESVERGDPEPLFRRLGAIDLSSTSARAALRSTLDYYILTDGFPELIGKTDLHWCAHRLAEYLQLTIANDLYRFYNIRATGTFEELLGLVARESGQLASYRQMAETLGVQERTVVEYLDYLERVHLVSQSQFYSQSRAKRVRRQRKIYLSNPGVRNAILGGVNRGTLSNAQSMGSIVESVVHEHSKRLVYCLEPGPEPSAFYWRDQRNREVDIVVEVAGKPIPIEVKYRTDPGRDLEGIRSFLAQSPSSPFGIVVTRDTLRRDGNLVFIPLPRFLVAV